jgi:ParB-like chromosome segregation protein Spo0J
MSDRDAQVINLSENMKRKDLNILQEAIAISKIPGTISEIAKELGTSPTWVQIRLKLLNLEPEIQKEAASGVLNQHHILKISSIKQPEARFEAVRKIIEHKSKDSRAADLVIKKNKQFADSKKVRSRPEIFEIQNLLREKLGNGLHTRLLGWCAGEISNIDLHTSIKEYCEEKGISYQIPEFDQRLSEVA